MFLNSNYAISLNNYFYFIKINIKENNYVSYRPIKVFFLDWESYYVAGKKGK